MHSMHHSVKGSKDEVADSSSSGVVWRTRSISGSCRVCDVDNAAQARICSQVSTISECSLHCKIFPFEYDHIADKLTVVPPSCDATACLNLWVDDAALLIKPRVMEIAAERIPSQTIYTDFSRHYIQDYMCVNQIAQVC